MVRCAKPKQAIKYIIKEIPVNKDIHVITTQNSEKKCVNNVTIIQKVTALIINNETAKPCQSHIFVSTL